MLEQDVLGKLNALTEVQTVTVTSELGEQGKSEIARYLAIRYGGSIDIKIFEHSTWSDFNWQNADSSNQNIAKRIKQRLFKRQSIKLKPEELSEIGNLSEQYGMALDRTCYFTVTENLRWGKGDFGDSGSCYFTNKAYSLDTLEANGARALLFWNSGIPTKRGIGRCWLIYNDVGILLFNSYGLICREDDAKQSGGGTGRRDTSLLKMGMVLGTYLGLECTKTRLLVNNSADEPVYINREEGAESIPGGNAALLSVKPSACSLFSIEMTDPTLFCCQCCSMRSRGNQADLGFKMTPKNQLVCSSCFTSLYFECGACKILGERDQRKVVSNYASFVCKACLPSFPKCTHCGGYSIRESIFHTDDGTRYCKSCFANLVNECMCCTRKFTSKLMNKKGICPLCVDERRRTRQAVEKAVGEQLILSPQQIVPEEAPLFDQRFYRDLKKWAESEADPTRTKREVPDLVINWPDIMSTQALSDFMSSSHGNAIEAQRLRETLHVEEG